MNPMIGMAMSKQYTLRVVIEAGGDEFWEDIEKRGVTGCDEVLDLMRDAVFSVGLVDDENCWISIESYKNSANI